MRLGACAPLAVGLGACADLRRLGAYAPAGVDPNSAAADAVTAAARAPQAYPDLKRLPAAPPTTPPAAYAAKAQAQRAARARLQGWVAANPADTVDSEAYAGAGRGRVLDPAREAPTDDQAARSAAWAARLREQARPPPPPKP